MFERGFYLNRDLWDLWDYLGKGECLVTTGFINVTLKTLFLFYAICSDKTV